MPGSTNTAPPSPSSVAGLGERGLLARLRDRIPPPPPWVAIGVGDDAAVLEPARNHLEVATTDILVEGVHFDRRLSAPAAIGHKAMAVNVSDLAAMGAEPRAALLSLVLPDRLAVSEFDALLDGVLAACVRYRVALVGGNLSRSPGPLVVDVTALGVVRRRRVLGRSGARPGDELYLSGSIGAGAAGLEWLQASAPAAPPEPAAAMVERYRCPEPRVRLGAIVGRSRAASACVDLSDGLADAVRQIAQASGVGVTLDADAIPVEPGAREWFARQGRDPLAAALAGGEDYELVFAVPGRRRRAFLAAARAAGEAPVTRIGAVTGGPDLTLVRNGRAEALPDGFAHFTGGA